MKFLSVASLLITAIAFSACGDTPSAPVEEVSSPSPSPEKKSDAPPLPLSEAERFKQVVCRNTDGFEAGLQISMRDANALVAIRDSALKTIDDGGTVALLVEIATEQLRQQGNSEDVARKMANGIIDGSLKWRAGMRNDEQLLFCPYPEY